MPSPRTRTTPLPGIGVQHDLTTLEGQHLSVIAHRDGSRSLNVYRRDDPDACALSLHLTAQEATVLADALMPMHHAPRLLHGTDLGLVAERIPLATTSRWNGRLLGETQMRTRTGSSTVAVLRGAKRPGHLVSVLLPAWARPAGRPIQIWVMWVSGRGVTRCLVLLRSR